MKHILLSGLLALAACGPAPTQLAPYEHEAVFVSDAAPPPDAGADPGADADPCAAQATGCPCDVEDQTIECGLVHQQFGDYIRCSPAYRTCKNGAWGACASDRVVGVP